MNINFPSITVENISKTVYDDYTSQNINNVYDISAGERVQTQDASTLQIKVLENQNIPISYQYINRIVRMLNDTQVNVGFVRKDYGAKNTGYFQDMGITDTDDRFLQNNISVVDNLIHVEDLLSEQHYGYASYDDKFGRNKSSWHKDIKQDSSVILNNVILNENKLNTPDELNNLENMSGYDNKILGKTLLVDDLVVGNLQDTAGNYSSIFIVNDDLEYVNNDLHINGDKKIFFGSQVSVRGTTVTAGDAYISRYNTNLTINTNSGVQIDIDKDNNSNTQQFSIMHNGRLTTLFNIIENGETSFNIKRANLSIKDDTNNLLFTVNNTDTSDRQSQVAVSGVNTLFQLNGYTIISGTDGTTNLDPLVQDQNNPNYNIYDVGLDVSHSTYLRGDLHVQPDKKVVLPHSDNTFFRDDDMDLTKKMMLFQMIFG